MWRLCIALGPDELLQGYFNTIYSVRQLPFSNSVHAVPWRSADPRNWRCKEKRKNKHCTVSCITQWMQRASRVHREMNRLGNESDFMQSCEWSRFSLPAGFISKQLKDPQKSKVVTAPLLFTFQLNLLHITWNTKFKNLSTRNKWTEILCYIQSIYKILLQPYTCSPQYKAIPDKLCNTHTHTNILMTALLCRVQEL